MKVIAAINGKITAETAALYAMKYAALNSFTLVLLHIKNLQDDIDEVDRSINNIQEIAAEYSISAEKVILEGNNLSALSEYMKSNTVDTFFCSTRAKKRFFSKSFSESIVKAAFPADIAVVRVVHVNSALNVDSIIMPIRDSRLSIQKFTFFTSMAKAYNAKGILLSINVVTKNRLSKLTLHKTKQMLKKTDSDLSHYFKLASIEGVELKTKHSICENETKTLHNFMGSGEYQLMIIGAKRLTVFSRLLGEKPIENILRETSINTIAYYSKKDK